MQGTEEQRVKGRAAVMKFALCLLFCALYSVLCAPRLHAEVIDRVVAYVDDTAITLSELQKQYAKVKETVSSITEEEVLNSMVNSQLLLKEAKKMRLDAPTKDEILKDYIDIKIKAAIIIKDEEIDKFYNEHWKDFKDRDHAAVREEIEKYLSELETNKQLKKHLEELRSRAEVKVQLKEEGL